MSRFFLTLALFALSHTALAGERLELTNSLAALLNGAGSEEVKEGLGETRHHKRVVYTAPAACQLRLERSPMAGKSSGETNWSRTQVTLALGRTEVTRAHHTVVLKPTTPWTRARCDGRGECASEARTKVTLVLGSPVFAKRAERIFQYLSEACG